MELLEHDITVYMLYPDNAEEMSLKPRTSSSTTECSVSQDRIGMRSKAISRPVMWNTRFLNSPTDSMAIYQLRRDAPVEAAFCQPRQSGRTA